MSNDLAWSRFFAFLAIWRKNNGFRPCQFTNFALSPCYHSTAILSRPHRALLNEKNTAKDVCFAKKRGLEKTEMLS